MFYENVNAKNMNGNACNYDIKTELLKSYGMIEVRKDIISINFSRDSSKILKII